MKCAPCLILVLVVETVWIRPARKVELRCCRHDQRRSRYFVVFPVEIALIDVCSREYA